MLASVRSGSWFLPGALVAAGLFRLESFLWPLMPDESGFVLVGRSWDPEPGSLYGPLWVDRPPVLIGATRLADRLAGEYGPRVLAALLVLLMVAAAYRIGMLLGGRRSAVWTSLAAVALTAVPDLTLYQSKSESLGVPLVTVSCWAALEAVQRSGRASALLWLTAGGVGGLALGMKQNLFGGLVFAAVLLLAAARTSRLTGRQALRGAGWAGLGVAVPVIGVCSWAVASGAGLHALWYQLYGFRADAVDVILSGSTTTTLGRLANLVSLFLLSGMALLLGWFLLRLGPVLRFRAEVAVAALVMTVVDGVGLLLSGSYWGSNLAALLPGVLLATALLAGTPERRTYVGTRALVVLSTCSAVLITAGWVEDSLDGGHAPTSTYFGEAVGAVAEPGDSVVVLYGNANVVLSSGLDPAYEHLWSLPLRTLDPGAAQLRAVVAGPLPPTWVVEWYPPHYFDLDKEGELRSLLEQRYDVATRQCGHTVRLLKGQSRPPLERITCRKPWR